MKELVKQYLDQGISRRTLMANLSAAGLSAVAANTVAQALAPVSAQAAAASPGAVRDVTGTGGQLYLQQLKAAGVEVLLLQSVDRRRTDFRRVRERAGGSTHQGRAGRRGRRHGGRLCATVGQSRRLQRCQCRPAKRR